MGKFSRFLPLVLVLGATAVAFGNVSLPPLFADHAVLQRGQPLRIWGWADAGEPVTVTLAGFSAETRASSAGAWSVTLPALNASNEPHELRVRGHNEIVARDILIGDVWLCGGQSNMEMPVTTSLDAAHEIAAANFPAVREIKVDRHLAAAPVDSFTATSWRLATPEDVGQFSAVGYYFAREMIRATGVPVGLINCTWSGTPIEPWMSAEALASKPEFAVVAARWKADVAAYPERRKVYEQTVAQWKRDEATALNQGEAAHAAFVAAHRMPRPPASAPDHPYPANPSALYNGMLHPLRQTTLRGVLWYQGEANAVRATEYAALFQAMIVDWRNAFERPDLPFHWVQIANFEVDTDWPRLREAQSRALSLPNTGQAVAIEIGDPLDIHPANKQETGRRLSRIALAHVFGRAEEYSGPVFSTVQFAGAEARVRFTHSDGLHSRSGRVMSLELAGVDRQLHPAEGRISGDTLIVTSAAVPAPVAVRYAWAASPRANLYNAAGLPAAPFRSDDW